MAPIEIWQVGGLKQPELEKTIEVDQEDSGYVLNSLGHQLTITGKKKGGSYRMHWPGGSEIGLAPGEVIMLDEGKVAKGV